MLQTSVFRQDIPFSACPAGKRCPLSFHLPFGQAVRALVQDAVQEIRSKLLGDAHMILLLPAKIVESRFLFRIVFSSSTERSAISSGDNRYFTFADTFTLRFCRLLYSGSRANALRKDCHHRNLQELQAFPQAFRQGRRRAIEAITGLRIHQNRTPAGLQRIAHIPQKTHLRDKFLRRDTAQAAHDIFLSHEPIGSTYDVEWLRIKNPGSNLQVDEAGMIHQNQTGFFSPQALHSLFRIR